MEVEEWGLCGWLVGRPVKLGWGRCVVCLGGKVESQPSLLHRSAYSLFPGYGLILYCGWNGLIGDFRHCGTILPFSGWDDDRNIN